jgi:hypothetical protein
MVRESVWSGAEPEIAADAEVPAAPVVTGTVGASALGVLTIAIY